MKLPHANRAVVERGKIVDYLLNAAHPDNGGKAKFFAGLGFRRDNWKELAEAFVKVATESAVASTEESPHGRKYVIIANAKSLVGKAAIVQTIWIVDRGFDMPRLVTAYPVESTAQ
jgi:hypothetical protein